MGILSWDLEVKGADKAEKAIEGVDDAARAAADGMKAADGAADQLGRGLSESEKAARKADAAFEDAARSAEKAGRAADGAGDGVGGLNDRVRDGLTGFDEFGGRLGQVANALNVLSGVAIVGMVTGLRDAVTAMYESTEAGQAAKVAAEAQAAAISGVVDWLKQQKEITEATTAATWAKINADRAQAISADELNKVITRQYDAQREYAEALRELGILREQFGERGEKLGVSGFGKAPEELRRMQRLQAQVKSLGEELIELDKTREAEQNRLIAINNAVNKATAALDRSGTSFEEYAASVRTGKTAVEEFAEQWALLGDLQGQGLDKLIAGLPDTGAALTDALAPETVNPLLEAIASKAAGLAADTSAAYNAAVAEAVSLVDQTKAIAGNLLSARDGALGLADGMSAALDVATQMAGSIRTAYDAVTDAQMIATRNASTLAGEQLAAAQAAERRAVAEAQAAGISAENSTLVAQKARERHAAEEAVYRAQLAQAKAEEDAAKARQVFQAVDYALEGGKAAAKSIEAAALASLLSALPFGVGAPFVPAAITASVTYGLAAAAYGVGAGATIAAETPRSARPQPPDPLIDPATTREAGRRDGGQVGSGDVYVEFHGVPSAMFGDVVIKSVDEGNKRRTRRKTNLSKRNRGR